MYKKRSAAKRLQLDERLDERVLDHVQGVFRRPDGVDHRVEQPILVFPDQLAERGRLAGQGLLDQSVVVAHGFQRIGRGEIRESSGIRDARLRGPPSRPPQVFIMGRRSTTVKLLR